MQVPVPKMDIMPQILRKKSKIHCLRLRKDTSKNGHNAANLEKKVQNLLPATTKSERMQVKMDIMPQILRKKSKIHRLRPRKVKGCK